MCCRNISEHINGAQTVITTLTGLCIHPHSLNSLRLAWHHHRFIYNRIIELVHPSSTPSPSPPLHSAWLKWQSDNTSPCTCKPIVRDKCCVSLNTPRHMGKRVQQPATVTSKHVKDSLPLHSPQAAAAATAPSLFRAAPTM